MQGWDPGSCPQALKVLSLHLSSAFHCVVSVLRHALLLRQQSDFSRSRLRFHPPFHLIVNIDSFHHQNLSFTHNSSTEMAGRKPCSWYQACAMHPRQWGELNGQYSDEARENADSPGKQPCCYQRVEKIDTRKKKGIFQKHKNNGISDVETINSYMYTKI